MYNNIQDKDLSEKIKELWRIVGNSPMVAIRFTYKGELRRVYAKVEHRRH